MSSDNEPLGTANSVVAIAGELIKAAGDSPDVRESARQLGAAALTVSKLINNALLPVAAVNFAIDKARRYFEDRFPSELAAKTSQIPPEQLVEPLATVSGPALQGLAFSHDDARLKDMYLSLISAAMDKRRADSVHPAFAEIIRQLDVNDTLLLKTFTDNQNPTASIVNVFVRRSDLEARRAIRYLMQTVDDDGREEETPENAAAVDNLCRLGILEVDFKYPSSHPQAYSWVETRPEVIRLKSVASGIAAPEVQLEKGVCRLTAFGRKFVEAISAS